MFRWQKELDRLELQVKQILDLRRSLNRVQLGLSGLPSQEATAYLCVFAAGKGVRGAVILHLHASERLAIFLNEEGEVPRPEADSLARKGAGFAESMGFMVGELDWPILSNDKKGALWESLPLKKGGKPAVPASAKTPPLPAAGRSAEGAPAEKKSPPAAPEGSQPSGTRAKTAANQGGQKGKTEAPPAEAEKPIPVAMAPSGQKAPAGAEAEGLPPANGAPPLPPPLRQMSQLPTPAAMEERRRKFRENFGRFLASL